MPPITRLRIWWCSPPNSMPQPLPCENANTPSTLGKSRSRSGVNRAATYASHGRRAIHVAQNGNVIARPGSAVRPAITLKCVASQRLRIVRHGR